MALCSKPPKGNGARRKEDEMIDQVFAAYFQSEACKHVVSPTDTAYLLAVNDISDDGGGAFRAWLATADEMAKTAIRAAYEAENAKNLKIHLERMAAARAEFAAVRATGASKTKALKSAQAKYSRFTLKRCLK